MGGPGRSVGRVSATSRSVPVGRGAAGSSSSPSSTSLLTDSSSSAGGFSLPRSTVGLSSAAGRRGIAQTRVLSLKDWQGASSVWQAGPRGAHLRSNPLPLLQSWCLGTGLGRHRGPVTPGCEDGEGVLGKMQEPRAQGQH